MDAGAPGQPTPTTTPPLCLLVLPHSGAGGLDGSNAHMGTLTGSGVFPIGIDPERINELDTRTSGQNSGDGGQFRAKVCWAWIGSTWSRESLKLLAFEGLEENPECTTSCWCRSQSPAGRMSPSGSPVEKRDGRQVNGRFGFTQTPSTFGLLAGLPQLGAPPDGRPGRPRSRRHEPRLVEYVACQNKEFPGVLVLSEVAGRRRAWALGDPSNPQLGRLSSDAYALKMG